MPAASKSKRNCKPTRRGPEQKMLLLCVWDRRQLLPKVPEPGDFSLSKHRLCQSPQSAAQHRDPHGLQQDQDPTAFLVSQQGV